jgi:hypothetical protein
MSRHSIHIRSWAIWPLAILFSALVATSCWAQTPIVTQVQEDWELVIGTPSQNSDAPQVTCLISPVGNADSLHATFVVNHHDMPAFTAGGLQLQTWNGDEILASIRYPNQAVLNTIGETIRWTQVMRITAEGLVFEVVGGSSTTWGNFGGEGTLKLMVNTSLENLNGYDPAVSVKDSAVSYAGNRVRLLVLKRVRVYSATGLIGEDNNPRIVHSLN